MSTKMVAERGRGRPKLPNELHLRRIQVCLREWTIARATEEAAAQGLTLSEWLREIIEKSTRRLKPQIRKDS